MFCHNHSTDTSQEEIEEFSDKGSPESGSPESGSPESIDSSKPPSEPTKYEWKEITTDFFDAVKGKQSPFKIRICNLSYN